MNTYLPNTLTPVTPAAFYKALFAAWVKANGSNPAPIKNAVLTVMAQSALETGWWKYCHNFNFGNAKSVEGDNFDYTFFSCNEDLPIQLALKLEAASTPEAPCKITQSYPQENLDTIWFYPDHPGCRFRAFANITTGMEAYLAMLMKRFAKAWPAAEKGDPRGFVQALKAEGYFTAPLGPYETSVVEIFEELQKMTSLQ